MTNKDFKEGMEVSFSCGGETHTDWILHYSDNGEWYAYPDNNFQEWTTRINVDNIDDLQPKLRTIDDLECGDYVVNHNSGKRKCIGKCGEVYFLSLAGEYDIFGVIRTIKELKEELYTLCQPEEVKEETLRTRILELIRDSDQEWACDEIINLVQALKNLNK